MRTLLHNLYTSLHRVLTAPALWIALAVAAMALRLWMVFVQNWHSADYGCFLDPWVDFIRDNGYWQALAHEFSDYNPLYLYFLTLISYIPGEPVYGIKVLSLLGDVVLACYGARIVGLYRQQRWMPLCAFALILLTPVTWLDSAAWAQCDSLYTAAILAAVYYIMCRRPYASMVALGLALAFKLQTIFILPFFYVLLLKGYGNWRHLLVLAGVYLVTLIPAWLLGRPWHSLAMIYAHQGFGTSFDVAMLTLSLGNAYPAYTYVPVWLIMALTCVVAVAVALVGWWTVKRKSTPYTISFLATMAMFSLAAVPFVLPGMHERYVYPAAVMALVWVFYKPRQWWVALAMNYVALQCMSNVLAAWDYDMAFYYPFPFPFTMLPRLTFLAVVIALSRDYYLAVVGRKTAEQA